MVQQEKKDLNRQTRITNHLDWFEKEQLDLLDT